MKSFATLLLGLAYAENIILTPETTQDNGVDVALVWIPGADCDSSAYTSIADTYIQEAANNGQNAWVGISDIQYSGILPQPIDDYVSSTIGDLRNKGFSGDNIFLAGHSLGGVMAQNYAAENSEIKGSILMGSAMLRAYHEINSAGETVFNYPSPVLTLGGTKDGVLRVTRIAEAYYHQVENIVDSQSTMFPVVTVPGASHMSFMSGTAPTAFYNSDLNPEISEANAHQFVADQMTQFVGSVLGTNLPVSNRATDDFLAPLLEGMQMEGSWALKEPCDDKTLVNRATDPSCLHGSPWSAGFSQVNMAGSLPSGVSINNDDNFHFVWETDPVHLPQVNNTCSGDGSKCTLESITVTENWYWSTNDIDNGTYPVSAYEMKTKLDSRQRMQKDAGNSDADFSVTDETGNRCADINNESLQWGIAHSSTDAINRYNKIGQKYVMGDDKGPYNAGPLWIWTNIFYTPSDDKTTVTVQAPMMRTPTNYYIRSASGFHYCKVLSPFRVMEWIYVDSLREFDGLNSNSSTISLIQQ